ncbi:MAG: peptide chain release factor N(5)-glutamine methyltransferase [Desulfobacteraceae bacterium]|nr:peptide chain release factor N(5)-glutamine methyltransferase [Desulfobacteraceae bacterium]
MSDWIISKVISWSESYFRSNSIDNPRLTAEILLGFSLDIKRIELYLQHDRPLNKDELDFYKQLIKRRINREPVAYITGRKGFYNSEFLTPPNVLIPRPDTETLVENILTYLKPTDSKVKPKKILELGAGSGAIIISLADLFPEHLYFANDLSWEAIKTVKYNSKQILDNIKKINLFQTSWFDAIKRSPLFDIIISNPPYIKASEIETLAEEIKNFEPISALDGGEDGLECLNEIIVNCSDYLLPGGTLLLEMGFDQKEGVNDIVKTCPDLEQAEFEKDLAGHLRVAIIKKRLSTSK